MYKLLTKILLLAVAVCVANWAILRFIKLYANLNPRQAIFYRDDICRYEYILIGDSIFSSYYVQSEDQTIWRQIEKKADVKVFPAALNGANIRDFVNQAIYVSDVAKNGSTVFLNLMPTRDYEEIEQTYEREFEVLLGKYRYALYESAYYDLYVKLNSFLYWNFYGLYDGIVIDKPITVIPGAIKYYNVNDHVNRVWDADGDFAANRYKRFLASLGENDVLPSISYRELLNINNIFKRNGKNVVFVITPVNSYLIDKYSGSKVDFVNKLFDYNVVSLKKFLDDNMLEYLDLSGCVESNGFADLFHTNSYGDQIIAGKIAQYITKKNSDTKHNNHM